MGDISLTSGMRSNVTSLQGTISLLDRTQERLGSGKKVNSALDNPTSYFAAKSLSGRANDLTALKDSMGQAIQTIKAASNGIDGITKLIEAAKGLAASARSASTADRSTLAAQYNAIQTQITNLAADSSYQGKNLIKAAPDSLTVVFNEAGTNTVTVTGVASGAAGLSLATATANWATDGNIDTDLALMNTAITTLRTTASGLSSNLSIISTRQEFTSNIVNTLNTGADALTLADMNEEGANMLALQTRQSLGVTALSLSSQAAQSILKLF